jgi:hypothetical protein
MSQLEDLLQRCTVKLMLPDRMGWGTGFFVAPGWILTCAHVVREAQGQEIAVRWQQEHWAQAVVEQLWPAPDDLALLRVMPPTNANPPCVYLDEAVESRDPLYLFGYPDQDFPNGCPVTFGCEGLTGDDPALIKFALGQVRPGMSGSPLLNQRTGRVCGMVKFTRDRSFDLGGGAIPTTVILKQFPELRSLQQAFHAKDRRWVNLITTQPVIDFQPYLKAILANDDYREWQEVYTPTTVEERCRMPEKETVIASQRRFSSRLKLRAETVKSDKREQGDQPDRSPEPQERVEQWDVLAGLRNYAAEHVVLIGKPGSGKSTSLERLLWEDAEKALQDPNARIPVLVKLRRCTGTIEGLIRDFLVGHQVALELAQIEELLRQGRFLLLLDGLNELPESFKTEVANFRDRYRRNTPMIVSMRDLGGGGTLGIEKMLKMLPLTKPQMREFVRGYLEEKGDRLFQQLQGNRLRKFAETPLLLWMLCWVFDHNGKVPANLGLAFREFTQLYDQDIPGNDPADPKDKWLKPLRYLAFVMIQGKPLLDPQLSILREDAEDFLTAYLRQEGRSNPRESAELWLKDLLKYHLIQPVIQPNSKEHIEFRHQLIQEYYAAEYLLQQLPDLLRDENRFKRDYLNYLKWTEPVALMLALVEERNQCLRLVKLALSIDLMLGTKIASSVRENHKNNAISLIADLEISEKLKLRLIASTNSAGGANYLQKAISSINFEIRKEASTELLKMTNSTAANFLIYNLENAHQEVCLTMHEESEEGFKSNQYLKDSFRDRLINPWSNCLDISLCKGWRITAIVSAKELARINPKQLILRLKAMYHESDVISKLRVVDIIQAIAVDGEILSKMPNVDKLATYFLVNIIRYSDTSLLRKFAGVTLNCLETIDENILKKELKKLLKSNNPEFIESAVDIIRIVDFPEKAEFLKMALKSNEFVLKSNVLEILASSGREPINFSTELLDYDDRIYLFNLSGELWRNFENTPFEDFPTNISEYRILSSQEMSVLNDIWNDHSYIEEKYSAEDLFLKSMEEERTREKHNWEYNAFKSKNAIGCWEALWDDDLDTRWHLVLPAFSDVPVGDPEDLTLLLSILKLPYLKHFNPLKEIISAIQNRCKYYNYEIFCSPSAQL